MWNPRVGGEKELDDRFKTAELGSPPRRRGKGVNVNCSADDIGITPAWAGKSPAFIENGHTNEDHPRMGGEKPPIHSWLSVGTGITPAWAGKR